MRSSSLDRRRWSSEGAPARCTRHGSSPMAITRRRAVSVEVKWMCASLVRALRTWSSMAPWLTSPPSMWATGMRRARAVGRGRKHLVAVGDQQQDVGSPSGKCIGQPQDCYADRFGHAGVSVGTEQALDARLDWESVALDFVNSVAELRREMRAENEHAQVRCRDARQVRAAASRDGCNRRARW